ncbi:DUF5666 domain-containing protein [Aliifodinibius salicampi]|uniref:DUF5666 domain-containing protein n=1 Tax=Fodinibius salicampi TaxID=1920655 RepID=A0ABT3Q0X6_9BACT|nr:DUF5666 domain-containing protein [Fodinibius salicampi]MCW9713777.1 DUF5666 domain-containing protein [Fodinibius salicampi]
MNKTGKLNSKIGISLLILTFTACTLDGISGSNSDTITKEDLQAAGQILGESLSSNNSGVLLSLNDALTNFSSTDFAETASKSTPSSPVIQNGHSGRGNETNYQHSYDSETGTHTISFRREVQRSLFEKTVTDTLYYTFRDNGGSFIEFPRQESDRIESITYNGKREGEISTLKKESFFVRTDTFLIDGLSDGSSTLSIDGVHNGEGTITIDETGNGSLERSYELEINFLNIEIEKSPAGDINIQRGVTGTLSWEMKIERGSDSKTMRGTIELSGDGTALLHFKNILDLFQINTNDGDLKDLEHEFEGGVQSMDIDGKGVTLVNGRTVYLTNDTEFDNDAYPDLKSVQQALNNGTLIWTEGEGLVQNGRFNVSEIEFEEGYEADDDDDEDREEEIDFEELITSVNIEAGTFTLGNQVIVEMNDQTVIENSSEYRSLQEVADALDQGHTVEADGSAVQAGEGSNADLIATSVDFDREESGDSEDSNDSDEED